MAKVVGYLPFLEWDISFWFQPLPLQALEDEAGKLEALSSHLSVSLKETDEVKKPNVELEKGLWRLWGG